MGNKRKVGLWLYQNGGGDLIQKQIIKKLKEREIKTVTGLNLRNAVAHNKSIICNSDEGKEVKVEKLDLFFSYNAGQQTKYQTYLYQALNHEVPCINSYESFALTEDKFQTAFILRRNNIATAEYQVCHRDDTKELENVLKRWGKMIYKPVNGWGGAGLTKIENQEALDMLMPFINKMNDRVLYLERFVKYDNTDFRVDIVDGEFVACYGRKAKKGSWKTNITSGGSIFLRDPDDEVIDIAKRAAKACGTDIAGVDIIYDMEREEYVVLEVNGIPAFATPEQEAMGLNFNDKKIDLIIDLIDKRTIAA